jgi:hypothetical protein
MNAGMGYGLDAFSTGGRSVVSLHVPVHSQQEESSHANLDRMEAAQRNTRKILAKRAQGGGQLA